MELTWELYEKPVADVWVAEVDGGWYGVRSHSLLARFIFVRHSRNTPSEGTNYD